MDDAIPEAAEKASVGEMCKLGLIDIDEVAGKCRGALQMPVNAMFKWCSPCVWLIFLDFMAIQVMLQGHNAALISALKTSPKAATSASRICGQKVVCLDGNTLAHPTKRHSYS